MIEFCKKLPKIELHAHLNGSLSEQTLLRLGCNLSNVEEYQKLTRLITKSDKNLDDCFKLFQVAHNVTNNVESVYEATQQVIYDFFDDNVVYLELRTTPRQEHTMTKQDYIESVVKAIKNQNKLIVKLILSLDRRHDQKTSNEALDLIIKMKDKYPEIIKGVDLCGDPTIGHFDSKLFEKAREKGLKVTIHCAEKINNEEVGKILNFKPDRLGHGTFLHPNYGGTKENWTLYEKLKIPIECCMTSNIICGTSKSYSNHHIQEWINSGLPFCINTDDKGVFCTTLTQEYILLSQHYNLDQKKLWEISYNTIDYTFCEDSEKQQLRVKLKAFKF